jgi:hypothetical protein
MRARFVRATDRIRGTGRRSRSWLASRTKVNAL